ncbi:MAG: protein translocase subunit SecD [Candidatus Yanofskybacteria bacterium]|nr:protein translocase subunit SecD [Candidatus Yanofskybacteria bacterium]
MLRKFTPLIILAAALFLAVFVYPQGWDKGADIVNAKLKVQSSKFKVPHMFKVPSFRLGLDLLGGTHLVYQADLSDSSGQDAGDAMAGVRDVIERRVNLFGVAEPLVQIEGRDRLVVELAGISDVNQAIQMIGQTPFLEFKEERTQEESQKILDAQQKGQQLGEDPYFQSTGLTGKHLKRSQLAFDQTTSQPQISLELNDDGAKLFAEITRRNLGKRVAIYIDGLVISAPTVQSEIQGGRAVISGGFTIKEARDLANNLNAGALPVPITLISQQTIGPSLGQESLQRSLRAGLYGLLLVAIFMILFYRLPGVVSVLALLIYTIIVLAIYKLVPVTLTLAGIAGFILSLGMAVDANVLIFARFREEFKAGKSLPQSFNEGFHRAWYSIRDSHVTTILGAIILYIFSISVVKGFALTLGIGVLMSLFSSIVVTKSFLRLFIGQKLEKRRWLF